MKTVKLPFWENSIHKDAELQNGWVMNYKGKLKCFNVKPYHLIVALTDQPAVDFLITDILAILKLLPS